MTEAVATAIDVWVARQHPNLSVVMLRRRPWDYTTSAPLERVTAVLSDGSEREFVLKHVGPGEVCDEARRVKPAFVLDPQREIEVYRRLLAPLQVGPHMVGSSASPQADSCWLLLEYVDGYRLHEIGEMATWLAVAGRLRSLHERLASLDSPLLRREARLIEYNREWYAVWLNRALCFFDTEGPRHSRRNGDALRWLAERYDKLIERLTSLPQTIIHGEFYPSNVLVTRAPDNPLVYPIDWEMTSIGPGVMDLAALTSGPWREEDRLSMIAAYVAASAPYADVAEVTENVEYAQIHLAVQWLGWFGRRQAPAGHAHDWLAEAVDRAEALNF